MDCDSQNGSLAADSEDNSRRSREPEDTDEIIMAKFDERIGFLGGGNMAFAIGSGMVNRGLVKPSQILASGPHLENLIRWKKMGSETTADNEDVIIKCDIIFICVKPHILEKCAAEIQRKHIRSIRDSDKLFISVIAGISIEVIEKHFYFIPQLKIIRSMPNTPMQVGEGCTVFSPGRYVTQHDVEKINMILNSLGTAQEVPEKMINAFSAITGCGPAYIYTIIEALADGGVKQGIPKQTALQVAAQMIYGTAKTVLETGKHPAVLRDEVCSPGGSTIAAVHELEKGGIRNIFINAVEKATLRSEELGQSAAD
ncbi:Pyrroline-5-carboxylate reductase [Sergentomyia squamirostris]